MDKIFVNKEISRKILSTWYIKKFYMNICKFIKNGKIIAITLSKTYINKIMKIGKWKRGPTNKSETGIPG